MNDPELAMERYHFVQTCYTEGVAADEVHQRARAEGHDFEGHLLEATIQRIYAHPSNTSQEEI